MEKLVAKAIADVGTVLLGKEHQIRLALCCLFSQGHLLIEDLPGMGKTTLSQALAKVLGLSYNRIQFTSDLLPADILGVSIFDQGSGKFSFHQGPIFTQILLADEINRTTPKSQSALLEAMAEGQVTIEGETRPLPKPFFVIATQNPITQSGTFPLPESQLDRFLMKISLGYPDPSSELQLFKGIDSRRQLAALNPVIDVQQLLKIQEQVENIKTSEALLAYLQRLVEFSRSQADFAHGLSPRGALALLRCAKAWAMMEGRGHVIPEDLQAVLPAVAEHRLNSALDQHGEGGSMVARMLDAVDVIA